MFVLSFKKKLKKLYKCTAEPTNYKTGHVLGQLLSLVKLKNCQVKNYQLSSSNHQAQQHHDYNYATSKQCCRSWRCCRKIWEKFTLYLDKFGQKWLKF